MKKVNVIVRDRNTIVLEENAEKGDYIDLSSLSNVDFSNIEDLLDKGLDKVYEKKLADYKKLIDSENNIKLNQELSEYKTKITNLENKIDILKNDHDNALALQKEKLESQFSLDKQALLDKVNGFEIAKQQEIKELKNQNNIDIEKLKNQIELLKVESEQKILNETLKLTQEYNNKINELEKQIKDEQSKAVIALKEKEIALNSLYEGKRLEYEQKLEEKEVLLKTKQEEYNALQRQKVALNVKQTGEDLESWCDNEVISYMQNGLFNCTWEKDNKVIKNEDEKKGSKADYIFKIYASEEHLEEELLAAICLEMKDENPDSANKKKNADHYATLDKNRDKKNCKYALLVSNLETDKPNDLPIYKVNSYKDMYVVRPAYMMTFLNMIASLSTRFSELILADNQQQLEIKNSRELMEEFDSLKNTYLDKPLEQLNKNIEDILKQNESILKASKSIDDICSKITKNYIKI